MDLDLFDNFTTSSGASAAPVAAVAKDITIGGDSTARKRAREEDSSSVSAPLEPEKGKIILRTKCYITQSIKVLYRSINTIHMPPLKFLIDHIHTFNYAFVCR